MTRSRAGLRPSSVAHLGGEESGGRRVPVVCLFCGGAQCPAVYRGTGLVVAPWFLGIARRNPLYICSGQIIGYSQSMRVVGLDYGERRIGVAVSDPSGILARPIGVLRPARGPAAVLGEMVNEVTRLAREEDGLARIVIGLPLHLDGSPTETTAAVLALAGPLSARTGLPVCFQDERLSSREAESRLAVTQRDWRRRKANLDAAAAAVILQDYLDSGPAGSGQERHRA